MWLWRCTSAAGTFHQLNMSYKGCKLYITGTISFLTKINFALFFEHYMKSIWKGNWWVQHISWICGFELPNLQTGKLANPSIISHEKACHMRKTLNYIYKMRDISSQKDNTQCSLVNCHNNQFHSYCFNGN